MFDTRTSIVLPIQESFDIARGRNSIRTLISLRHWPVTFVARAATGLTALGELLLLTGNSRVIPVRAEILGNDQGSGIVLDCRLDLQATSLPQWEEKLDKLTRAVDELIVEADNAHVVLKAFVYVAQE